MVPTAVFSGGQDTLADPRDVAVLLTQVSLTHQDPNPNPRSVLGTRTVQVLISVFSGASAGPPPAHPPLGTSGLHLGT